MTINPYLNLTRALKAALAKASWDLSRDALISRRNLTKIKDSHPGEKAIIICNGPSLLRVDMSSLNNVFTIGLNKINLLFESSSFRPNCIVAVNSYVISQNKDFYSLTDIPLFLDQKGARNVNLKASSTRSLLFSSEGHPGFSRDIRLAVNQGATVTYVAMQLAYFMGFSRIALIGCDHDFVTKGPDHKLVTSGVIDPNHFDPRYFAGGVPWQLPSIAESEESYMKGKRFYGYDNRLIYNSTVGGKLEIFPRLPLDQFLALA
jgi:hypothetical protein